MKPSYNNTRQHLLDVGYRIMMVEGFSGVGLNEILQTVGAPKDSFYHYFKSKEQLDQTLLKDYFRVYLADMNQRFSTPGLNAHERLMSYWQKWLGNACPPCDEQHCLVVKLSVEITDPPGSVRITLRGGSNGIIERLAGCLGQGRDSDSLAPYDVWHMVSVLCQLWLGVSLLSELHRSPEPPKTAMQTACSLLEV